jgi:hypothetical protein
MAFASDYFASIDAKLQQIFAAKFETKSQIEELLRELSLTVEELEKTYLTVSEHANVLRVRRAVLIGKICLFVKSSLLHGEWTNWAAENFYDDIRTLQKFMAIAEFPFTEKYANLGTERVYQLTRVKHLLDEGKSVEDLFKSAGQSAVLKEYSPQKLQRTVNVILNKKCLENKGISLSNESLVKLTENFSLIENNAGIMAELERGIEINADMNKLTDVLVGSGAGSQGGKKKVFSFKRKNLDLVLEEFISSLQAALNEGQSVKNEERLRFAAKLIAEYFQMRDKGLKGGNKDENLFCLANATNYSGGEQAMQLPA